MGRTRKHKRGNKRKISEQTESKKDETPKETAAELMAYRLEVYREVAINYTALKGMMKLIYSRTSIIRTFFSGPYFFMNIN